MAILRSSYAEIIVAYAFSVSVIHSTLAVHRGILDFSLLTTVSDP